MLLKVFKKVLACMFTADTAGVQQEHVLTVPETVEKTTERYGLVPQLDHLQRL